MTKFMSKMAGGAAAVVALTSAFGANAATVLYSGGGTLAEKVYREIFNQFGDTSSNELCAKLPAAYCPATPYNSNVAVLYAGVGSGNGKSALVNYDASKLIAGSRVPDGTPTPSTTAYGTYYGTGVGLNWVPAAGAPFFPKMTFGGSDDPLTSTDITTYTTGNVTPAVDKTPKYGPLIQIPAFVAPVGVAFTPATGTWTPKNTVPTGGSSGVNLSTTTLCGIFTGAITQWDDAEITADNKRVKLGSGQITVVYRNDSSGTTFLFTNALLNQCGSASNHTAAQTHPFPDQWLTDAGVANSLPFTSGNSFYIRIFTAGHLPSNFYNNNAFAGVTGGAKGNGGVQLAIDSTPGAIGYLSVDFSQPIVTGNDSKGNPVAANANIQSWYSASTAGAAKAFMAPSATNASYIMSTTTPPAGADITNPLKWGVVNPTPTGTRAYPIGGFTFFDLYTCYADTATVNALVGSTAPQGLLRYFYGNATATNTLKANGFSAIPANWSNAVKSLLWTNTATKIAKAGTTSTACASVSPGA